MASELHLFFFPFMAPGHMIPMIDMARLFASRGVRSTVVTTPANAALVEPTLDRARACGNHVQLLLLQLPSSGNESCPENLLHISTHEGHVRFVISLPALRHPFERLVREYAPDAIVSDAFLPWTADVAVEVGIPRLMFSGSGFYSVCAEHSLQQCNLWIDGTFDDQKTLVLPGLPHRIEIKKTQISDPTKVSKELNKLIDRMKESEKATYGMVTNSFYELEPDYVEQCKGSIVKNSWHIGPLSLWNREESDAGARGGRTSIDGQRCKSWLDSKKPRSVIYVCFGSLCNFNITQMREIAAGLVSSPHPFIWVVGKGEEEKEGKNKLWTPEIQPDVEKCLVVRGWAPQVTILNHQAVGAFVTHCGWNSCLEGVAAGVPMVTWPLFAEQFFNEKLMVEILRVGVSIGDVNYALEEEERVVVRGEEISRALAAVMDGGGDGEEMRKRVGELRLRAERAVTIGGSSDDDLNHLIRELVGKRKTS